MIILTLTVATFARSVPDLEATDPGCCAQPVEADTTGTTASMLFDMTTRKRVTVSLPIDVLEAANNEAGGNLSAYAAKALMAQAVRDSAARLARWQESRRDTLAELDELQLDALDELNGGSAA